MYQKIFNKKAKDEHRALGDVLTTYDIAVYLKEKQNIMPENYILTI